MKPHFTTNAQNIFHFTPTRLITHHRNLSKVNANGLTGKKNGLVKCRQLHLQLNALRCLSVATGRDIQG
jgi:hypothetical protein